MGGLLFSKDHCLLSWEERLSSFEYNLITGTE